VTGRYLLDTNIIIAIFNGETLLQRRVTNTPEVFISIVSQGELFYGAYNSQRVEANISRLEQFSANIAILDCDSKTARSYGILKSKLRKQGTPIPENDLWIAALAHQYDLTLVSRDPHFSVINDVRRENW
jgi:tRNA(fMet)-specific endonuclease VapC